METTQRGLLDAHRPPHYSVHLSDVSPIPQVHCNSLILLHSRTHVIIVLIRSIQGFIGRGNEELGGATEYFLEASSPLNVYVSLRSSHTSNADVVPHSANMFIYMTNVSSVCLRRRTP